MSSEPLYLSFDPLQLWRGRGCAIRRPNRRRNGKTHEDDTDRQKHQIRRPKMKKGSDDERCPNREWKGSRHSDERYGRNQQHVAYIKNHAGPDRPSLRRSTGQDHAIGKNIAAHGSQRVRGDDRQQQGAY